MRALLASESLAAVPAVVDEWGAPRRAAVVPTAADGLADRAAVVTPLVEALAAAGCAVTTVALDEDADPRRARATLADAELVAVAGGDPYRLAARLHATGAASVLVDALRRGVPYVGVSAGAMVLGPTLAPLRHTSPFPAPPDVPAALDGFDRLVLPHDDRPARRDRHDAARAAHPEVAVVTLRDDEALVVHGAHLEVRSDAGVVRDPDLPGVTFRAGTIDDAAGLAAVHTAAARAAWGSFLGTDRLAAWESPVAQWEERVRARRPPARLRIARDGDGLVGFAWIGPAPDPDVPARTGELDVFYTHPRCWGSGVGRSLHRWAVAALAAAGFDRAVLWTEERNLRPRRTYEAAGWVLDDGAVREREFLGVPIRELRHRIELAP